MTEPAVHGPGIWTWERAIAVTSRAGGPIVLVVLTSCFAIMMPGTFATRSNLQSMLSAQAVPGILALALLFPLVAGEFDFSGGAIASAGGTMFALSNGIHHWPWPVAAALIVIGGALAGAINGILVAYLGFGSFVATLATSGVVSGIALLQSGGQVLYLGISPSFLTLGQANALGVPTPVWCLLLVFLLVLYALRQTAWGRYSEAVGKNRAAATLAGIPVRRHVFLSFVVAGGLAGFAGLVLVAQVGSAQPSGGSVYTLGAFSAAFLGATMFRPGFYNPPGTILAILLIAVGVNGLTLSGVSAYVEQIFTGLVLLVAVGLSGVERITIRR
jgi:ribose transport system permease protein